MKPTIKLEETSGEKSFWRQYWSNLVRIFNPKTILDSDIYEYESEDFPALATAIRYSAFVIKTQLIVVNIIFWILFFNFAFCMATAPFVFLASLGAGFFAAIKLSIVVFLIFLGLLLLLVLARFAFNLYLVISMALLEIFNVIVKIEFNTREAE